MGKGKTHRVRKKSPPPETERWCMACQKMTIWKYNKLVGHSRCTECGSIFSARTEVPEERLQEVAERLMPWCNPSNNNNNNKNIIA